MGVKYHSPSMLGAPEHAVHHKVAHTLQHWNAQNQGFYSRVRTRDLVQNWWWKVEWNDEEIEGTVPIQLLKRQFATDWLLNSTVGKVWIVAFNCAQYQVFWWVFSNKEAGGGQRCMRRSSLILLLSMQFASNHLLNGTIGEMWFTAPFEAYYEGDWGRTHGDMGGDVGNRAIGNIEPLSPQYPTKTCNIGLVWKRWFRVFHWAYEWKICATPWCMQRW
jgi:hypothetical protein